MINYRMALKTKEGRTVLIESGYVTEKGTIDFELPKGIPPVSKIHMSWEVDDGNNSNSES